MNKARKDKYIKERIKEAVMPINFLNREFKKFETEEIKNKKDICEFTLDEILDYYVNRHMYSIEALKVLNSQMSLYSKWCLNNSYCSENNFSKITMKMFNECIDKSIVSKKIVDRKQIIGWCDQLPNPRDQVLLLGLFEGIKGKDYCEFVNMSCNDINDNILHIYNGRSIRISKILNMYISDSIAENTYYSTSGGMVKTMPLIDDGHVIKNYPNIKIGTSQFIKGRIIYNGITRSLKYVGVNDFINANNIYESGKIHMIRKRSRKLKMSPLEYIYSNNIKEVEHVFNCRLVKSIFSLKYEEYLK